MRVDASSPGIVWPVASIVAGALLLSVGCAPAAPPASMAASQGTSASSTTASAPAGATPARIKFQHSWVANNQVTGYYAAVDKGFYKDEGLDVEVVMGGPNLDPIQTVMGGATTLGQADAQAVAAARAEGLPISVLGARYQKAPNALICRSEAGVNTPADVVGKRVGASPKDRPITETALTLAGVDTNRVQFTATGADLTPLLSGQIDCRHGFSSNEPVALELQGFPTSVHLLYDMGYKQQGQPLFASEETVRTQRDALVRFIRASIKGWQYSFDHPEEATRILLDKAADLDYEKELRSLKEDEVLMATSFTAQNGLFAIDPDTWKESLSLMIKAGAINRPVTNEELLNPDLHRAARAGAS
jgi:NitT/TauT family transport system substrate-binding protein